MVVERKLTATARRAATLPKLDDYGLGPLLSKPVRPDALCRAVRQILRVA